MYMSKSSLYYEFIRYNKQYRRRDHVQLHLAKHKGLIKFKKKKKKKKKKKNYGTLPRSRI